MTRSPWVDSAIVEWLSVRLGFAIGTTNCETGGGGS